MTNEEKRPPAAPPPPARQQESLVGSLTPDLAQAAGYFVMGAVTVRAGGVAKEAIKQYGMTRRETTRQQEMTRRQEIRGRTAVDVARTQNPPPTGS